MTNSKAILTSLNVLIEMQSKATQVLQDLTKAIVGEKQPKVAKHEKAPAKKQSKIAKHEKAPQPKVETKAKRINYVDFFEKYRKQFANDNQISDLITKAKRARSEVVKITAKHEARLQVLLAIKNSPALSELAKQENLNMWVDYKTYKTYLQ